jgi:ribosome-associated toxin RatA of RatAB toxin-antitoxin module
MNTSAARRIDLGPMPVDQPMEVVDTQIVHAPMSTIFDLAKQVEQWPTHLAHYRYVKFRSRRADGGGEVEMSAFRPFEIGGFRASKIRIYWPTWWLSEMSISNDKPAIRFRHIGGITKGMEVEWTFAPTSNGTRVSIVHMWNGLRVPVIGRWAAVYVIGPVFVHGIASRTLAGLASVAERMSKRQQS